MTGYWIEVGGVSGVGVMLTAGYMLLSTKPIKSGQTIFGIVIVGLGGLDGQDVHIFILEIQSALMQDRTRMDVELVFAFDVFDVLLYLGEIGRQC